MFERARLLLSTSYAAALGLTLIGIGLVSYLLIQDDLNSEIDESLRAAASGLDPATFASATPGLDPAPTAEDDDDGGDDGDEDDAESDEEQSDDEEIDEDDVRLAPLPSDLFFLVFSASSGVVSNPRRVNLEGVDLAGMVTRAKESDIQEVHAEHGDYRMLVASLEDGSYLAVGRSLRLANHQLETLRTVFIAGGAIGLAFSLVSGFWLAGRTLQPIRRALESQRQFVSDASHELRTPIAVAKANAALMLGDPESTVESHLDQAETVAAELDRLTVLVGDLTTLARADEGRANLLLEPLDLGDLTQEVVRDMEALAEVRGVQLRFEMSPARIRGDRTRLRQLVVILIDNSLKYATKGGTVQVRCTDDGSRAELSVADDGPGISPADQDRIFERFYRADAERARSSGGTGLGLAIGKWIAEAHGGRISVESQPSRGTTFRVRLPRY